MKLSRRFRKNDRRHPRQRVLQVEALRERIVLDGSGLGVADPLPWFDPAALTFSFAPDGTSVAGEESSLFERLAPLGEVDAWQSEFNEAFNAWLTPLGATARQVPDTGSRFGVSGRTQGDTRFGDIRIAAVPLSRGVLATSVPHSAMVQGSWAGDILVNANAQWNNLQEVFAVAMHEFGHVLGMGHSIDPLSPMFVHGVHDAIAPTAADILALRDLYVGIQFEVESDGDGDTDSGSLEAEDAESVSSVDAVPFPFDPNTAVALTPAIGSTVRYTALGEITGAQSTIVYRLDPTLNEPEGLENLSLSLHSTGTTRLIANIAVFDSLGRQVESNVLHSGPGSVIVQAQGVESDEVYYIVVTPSVAAPLASRLGSFEIVMDYVPELQLSRKFSEVTLGPEKPVVDQDFHVSSSRLIHIHIDGQGEIDLQTAIFVQLLDSNGDVLNQIVMRPGTSRSAPLSFLPAGDYTLRLMSSSATGDLPESQLIIYLDEVSIDVGPGIFDPTGVPYLACDEPGADLSFCYAYEPIAPEPPTVPDPVPEIVSSDYPWWWEYGFTCADYGASELEFVQATDPLWWDFYVEVCQPTTPPATNPPVTNPPATNPPATNPPATNPPGGANTSPWQNLQNSYDVSANQQVTALDALVVINVLATHAGDTIAVTDTVSDIFPDVNGDFFVSALDALMVINQLAVARIAAEAELISADLSLADSVNAATAVRQDRVTDAALALLF